MYSGEGEEVRLAVTVMPTGNVEDWLREVEKSMTATVRDSIDRSLRVYPEVSHFHFKARKWSLLAQVCGDCPQIVLVGFRNPAKSGFYRGPGKW